MVILLFRENNSHSCAFLDHKAAAPVLLCFRPSVSDNNHSYLGVLQPPGANSPHVAVMAECCEVSTHLTTFTDFAIPGEKLAHTVTTDIYTPAPMLQYQ